MKMVPLNGPDHIKSFSTFRVTDRQKGYLAKTYETENISTDSAKAKFLCKKLGVVYVPGIELRGLEVKYCYQHL